MPSDRYQVQQDLGLRDPRSVVAKPVDNYYRVAANTVQLEGGGEFADLAAAIGASTPIIQKTLSEEEKRLQEEDIKKGVEARLRNQKDFKQAIEDGTISRAQSPWFVKGYMQQDGRISGMNYDEALRTAWASSDVKNSDDPQALSKFMGDFRTKWLDDHKGATPDWIDGFMPKMAQADNNLSAQHVAHRQRVIEERAKESFGIEVRKLQDQQTERESGMSPNDPLVQAGRQDVAAQIEALAARWVRNGMDGKDANRILADQIITKGIELRDADYARSVLDQVKTPGGSVSNIAEVAGKIAASEATIRDRNWSDKIHAEHDEDRPYAVASRNFGLQQIEHSKEQWAKEKQSYERTERVRARTNEMTMKIMAGQHVSPEEYQALAKDDASAAAWVKNFRHTLSVQGQEIITDQGAWATAMLRMANDPQSLNARDIFGGVTSGKWDRGAAMVMWNERQQMLAKGEGDAAGKNPLWATLNHGLVTSITADVTNLSGSKQLDASRASSAFRKFYAETMNNDQLTPSQKDEALLKKQLELMAHFNKLGLMKSQAAQDAGLATGTKIRGEGGGSAGSGPKPIPPRALEYLRQNPGTAADFEKQYNLAPGSAATYLNTTR